MSTAVSNLVSTEPARCSYIVPRKKRNCRMLVKPGKKFCGEHDVVKSINEPETHCPKTKTNRIVCPNDNKHTCNANRLEKHLLVCPSRPKPSQKYDLKGANTAIDSYNEIETPLTVNTVDDNQLINVIKRIEDIYENQCIKDNIQTALLEHNEVEQYINQNPAFGPAALKHLKQNSSLLAHLENDISYEPNEKIAFVEFGSGRGQLTYWVAKATNKDSESKSDKCDLQKHEKDAKFILIDKASHRHKFDNKLKDEAPQLSTTRIRVDIEDVVLGEIDALSDRKVIAIGKHLCGAATDLAINSLVNFVRNSVSRTEKTDKDINKNKPVLGIMIALCCHHRCSWKTFAGKKYLLENYGFSPNEFTLLCGLSSWATCGTGKPRNKEVIEGPTNNEESSQMEDINEHQAPIQRPEIVKRYDKLNLDQSKREEIGRKTKRILDAARCQFIKERMGLKSVALKYYTTTDISLENVVMIAHN